ncbi:hypothetical protein [Gimesia sp.]|uniref:hypothetical protein n=1 Tax=Gimesia sp. TaxID=2024833 RepID=UPI003A8E54AC
MMNVIFKLFSFLVVLVVIVATLNKHWWMPASSSQPHLSITKNLQVSDLVASISCPLTPQLNFADKDHLQHIITKIQEPHNQNLSSVFHLIHLFGAEAQARNSDGSTTRLVNMLLDGDSGKQYFKDGLILAETRWGLRFPEIDHADLSSQQRNTEAHPGQGLATLATAGIPLTATIIMPDGESQSVQQILDDVQANFVLDGDIYWDVVALAIYLAPADQWTDKFGRTISFDLIVDELISREQSNMLCAGTHGLIALTTLLRVDNETQILSSRHRDKLRRYLAQSVEQLVQAQLPEGGWASNWTVSYLETKPAMIPIENIIQSTGHHLEWLILLPHDLQPEPILLEQAARNLVRLVLTRIDSKKWRNKNFCPLVHATRSVILLAGDNPGQLILNSNKEAKAVSVDGTK